MFFLSGGIDSSANASIFSKNSKKNISTFSVGYDQDYKSLTDETKFAREHADRIQSKHYEKKLNLKQFLDFLPKMVQLQDEPIADPVCFPLYHLSKLAKENGVTVCQVGEGADELFWLSAMENKVKTPKFK